MYLVSTKPDVNQIQLIYCSFLQISSITALFYSTLHSKIQNNLHYHVHFIVNFPFIDDLLFTFYSKHQQKETALEGDNCLY